MNDIRIRTGALTVALSLIVAMLTLAHVAVIVFTFHLERGVFWLKLVDMDLEGNLPAFYSAVALLLCAAILAWITVAARQRGERFVFHWGLLALVFAFLSVDEMIQIHERFSGVIRRNFEVHKHLYTAWIIPYGIALLVFAGLYLRFLSQLPRSTLIGFLAAGGLFVTGAIGLESFSGVQFLEDKKVYSETYYWIILAEEVLEMVGVVVFLHVLLRHCERHMGGLGFVVGSPPRPRAGPKGPNPFDS